MIGVLFESVLKMSPVLAAALVLTALLRRSSAAMRHWILAAAVVVAAAMPLLQVLAPAWGRPLASSWFASDTASLTAVPAAPVPTDGRVEVSAGSPAVQTVAHAIEGRSLLTFLPVIWIAGSGMMLALLAVGLARLAWLTRRAAPIRDGEWHDALWERRLRGRVLREVAVRQSLETGVLVAWGAFRPQIILPATSRTWTASRIRIVVAHEVAHITRHDWPLQIVAELLRAACWFNPLVWVVVGRLRAESERACDDEVMSSGVEGPDYAAELLGIATELRGGRGWLPAPAMARASHLEGRVAAMLNPALNRTPLSPARRALSFVVALLVALGISGYAISAQTFSSIAGSVSDQLGGLVPNATLVLVQKATGNKYEVKSNSVGTFEFVGLPAGEYSLSSYVPGFKSAESTLVVGGGTVRRDVSLEMGTLEETIRVVGRRSIADVNQPPGNLAVKIVAAGQQPSSWERVYVRMQPKMLFVADGSAVAQTSGGAPACLPLSVGGNIKPPTKTKSVMPVYPESALQSGSDGLVELGAVIAPDGRMQSVRINSDADPALSRSAMDAVVQWEFTPTLLNCVAVNVQMRVHVRFVLEP